MKNKTLTILISILLLFASAGTAFAQVFKLELANPSQSISVGTSFDVKININTNGEETINGDALINFESDKLNISSAKKGDFYTYFSANTLGGSTSKYLASSWEESVAHAKSTTTDTLFATLTINPISAGSTQVSFDCTSGTEADSNINRSSDSKDIINCTGLTPLTLNIGASGPTSTPSPTLQATPTSTPSATPTSTPTRTPTPTTALQTPTATPQSLPRTGATEITFSLFSIGTILTVIGVLAIL